MCIMVTNNCCINISWYLHITPTYFKENYGVTKQTRNTYKSTRTMLKVLKMVAMALLGYSGWF